jgi:acylphosphatase
MGRSGKDETAPICRTVYFTGRVQGVGFRYTAYHLAQRFQVGGYVRNLRDGRVELVAEGPRDQVDGFVSAVQHELGAYVSNAQTADQPASGDYPRFDIRF